MGLLDSRPRRAVYKNRAGLFTKTAQGCLQKRLRAVYKNGSGLLNFFYQNRPLQGCENGFRRTDLKGTALLQIQSRDLAVFGNQ